jgi:hypothetical protein
LTSFTFCLLELLFASLYGNFYYNISPLCTSEKVVLREQPEIKDLLQTLMKQGLKKEQRRSYPIVLTSIQILRMVYETRADASSRMSADQISDVALSLEYVKQYGEAHKELNYKQACLLEQCVARRSYNLYSDVQRGEML